MILKIGSYNSINTYNLNQIKKKTPVFTAGVDNVSRHVENSLQRALALANQKIAEGLSVFEIPFVDESLDLRNLVLTLSPLEQRGKEILGLGIYHSKSGAERGYVPVLIGSMEQIRAGLQESKFADSLLNKLILESINDSVPQITDV
ncbi:MAG: hypothetical protein PHC64_09810 [Candidatus Gastranaerophilales bacterium]|nr:hypothetical protein [Candidatus Gastranaerophilales bacterium]